MTNPNQDPSKWRDKALELVEQSVEAASEGRPDVANTLATQAQVYANLHQTHTSGAIAADLIDIIRKGFGTLDNSLEEISRRLPAN
ncbi:hypothetical protein [Rhodococcus sp. NPDC060176]|uniref:hypothetical protein n=1 Tax=Rhodococcus sp. NPDC060176 TaxID=3347062 RepID=UPI003660F060